MPRKHSVSVRPNSALPKNQIQCLTEEDEAYPSRLRECSDAPIVLFYRGNADLNQSHVISMVGTRHATEYGKDLCLQFVRQLQELLPDTLIVSGLAYGIDIHAHRASCNRAWRPSAYWHTGWTVSIRLRTGERLPKCSVREDCSLNS